MAEFRQLRLPWVMEYTTPQYSLDIAWPEQRLGIEVTPLPAFDPSLPLQNGKRIRLKGTA